MQNKDFFTILTNEIHSVIAATADENGYLHYVLDMWYENFLRKHCKVETYYVRYADDFLILFQYENEAQMIILALKKMSAKFQLEVAEENTRILPLVRFKGTKEEFDFLGFTFFNTQTEEANIDRG